jgi:cobalt/nickel transport system permease protein
MANAIDGSATCDGSPAESAKKSGLDGIDPRTRLIASVLFSLLVAAASSLPALSAALALALVAAGWTGALTQGHWKRLIPVNAFVLLLLILLPCSGGATPLWTMGPVVFAQEGLLLAVQIGLKANAIVLGVLVLLAGLESATLGHALGHLGVPQKLTHLLLFTVRYLNVLHREYQRLRAAMKSRGFRPRVDWHTYRTVGYLVGMLLVRSLDRAERIVAAMKCRGFCGRFYLLDHFAFSVRDVWFSAVFLLALLSLAALEWA